MDSSQTAIGRYTPGAYPKKGSENTLSDSDCCLGLPSSHSPVSTPVLAGCGGGWTACRRPRNNIPIRMYSGKTVRYAKSRGLADAGPAEARSSRVRLLISIGYGRRMLRRRLAGRGIKSSTSWSSYQEAGRRRPSGARKHAAGQVRRGQGGGFRAADGFYGESEGGSPFHRAVQNTRTGASMPGTSENSGWEESHSTSPEVTRGGSQDIESEAEF